MIIDYIENAENYYCLSPEICKALSFLKANASSLKGKSGSAIEVDGITIKLKKYETSKTDRTWESHEKFTDLQYIISGEEYLAVAKPSEMESLGKQEGKDRIVWKGSGNRYFLKEGQFFILFPGEIHMTKLAVLESITVEKAILKVKA